MNYIHSDSPHDDAAAYVARQIARRLSDGKKVLWLLSGGSGIQVAVQASALLKNCDVNNLFVSLSDERYGSIGHADENWQQLEDAGFSLPGAHIYRPLIGQDRTVTTAAFSSWLEQTFASTAYSIGIFGIGSDGHTAGIKPHSIGVASRNYAVEFTGEDYERITMTAHAIRQLDEAVIQASGNDKISVIKTMLQAPLPPHEEFPAGILSSISDCTLYTTIKKEDIV